MGIRIHKMIGYAIIDLKINYTQNISDSRINTFGILGISYEHSETYTIRGYRKFLKNKLVDIKDHNLKYEISKELVDIKNLCKLGDGLQGFFYHHDNVLCIVPPTYYDEWYRYDNIIDITEEEANLPLNINHYKFIPNGIFPWKDIRKEKPIIPDCIRLLCEYCELFNDNKFIEELKPIVFTYWN